MFRGKVVYPTFLPHTPFSLSEFDLKVFHVLMVITMYIIFMKQAHFNFRAHFLKTLNVTHVDIM